MENNIWVVVLGIIGSLASIIGLIVWAKSSITNAIKNVAIREIEPIKQQNKQLSEENTRLQSDINTRLQLPSFSLDAIKLTELATERKVEEITKQRDEAIASKDKELETKLQSKLDEINTLKNSIEESNKERLNLENSLRNVLVKSDINHKSHNSIVLPTGYILLVRYKGKYGALQAIEQVSDFMRYAWWYQPDNFPDFSSGNPIFGTGEVDESRRNGTIIKIDSMNLEWSRRNRGTGYVYFGPSSTPSEEYELLVTNITNIESININNFENLFTKAGSSYYVETEAGNEAKLQTFLNAVRKVEDFETFYMSNSWSATIIIRNRKSKKIIEDLAKELNFVPNKFIEG